MCCAVFTDGNSHQTPHCRTQAPSLGFTVTHLRNTAPFQLPKEAVFHMISLNLTYPSSRLLFKLHGAKLGIKQRLKFRTAVDQL
ncbi:hypothetical protein ABKN59_004925 [Abortiporus biennis]